MADCLPQNRREVKMALSVFVAGVLVALGASKVPGLTIEPVELSECRQSLAVAASERDGCIQNAKDDRTDSTSASSGVGTGTAP